jgi:hypothetical protein
MLTFQNIRKAITKTCSRELEHVSVQVIFLGNGLDRLWAMGPVTGAPPLVHFIFWSSST